MTEHYLHMSDRKWLPITQGTFDINVRVSNTHQYPKYHLIKTETLGFHVFSPKCMWYRGSDNMWHQNCKLPTRHG